MNDDDGNEMAVVAAVHFLLIDRGNCHCNAITFLTPFSILFDSHNEYLVSWYLFLFDSILYTGSRGSRVGVYFCS